MFDKNRYEELVTEVGLDTKIAAVTKGVAIEQIIDAINNGVSIICESYVQEAEKKHEMIKHLLLKNKTQFHLIGHLQTNKARKASAIFDCIQSIDNIRIAKEVDKECKKINKQMKVFIEINSGDRNKSGVVIS